MGSYGIMSPLFQGAVANQRRMLPGATKDDVAVGMPGLGGAAGARPTPTVAGTVGATGAGGAGMDLSSVPGLQLPFVSPFDNLGEVGSNLRYGMGTVDKYKLGLGGVPGVFTGANAGNPYAERQASQYAGTKQWGPGLARGFNDFALGDLGSNLSSLFRTGGLDPYAYNNWRAGNQARENTLAPPPVPAGPPVDSIYNLFQPGAAGGGGNLTIGPNGNLVFGTGVGIGSGEQDVPFGATVDQFGNPIAPGQGPVDYLPNTGQDPRLNTLTPTYPPVPRPPTNVPGPADYYHAGLTGPGLTPEEQRLARSNNFNIRDLFGGYYGGGGAGGSGFANLSGFGGGI